jgi:hypothetical protein
MWVSSGRKPFNYQASSLLNTYSWCDFERGEEIGQDTCMIQNYTESGGIVITVNRALVHVPVRLEFVDSIPPNSHDDLPAGS